MAKGKAFGKLKSDNKPENGNDGDNTIDIAGASGTNKINGGDGNDNIVGSANADRVNAGDGDDIVRGGLGDDILFGNDGFDTAVFSGSILDYMWNWSNGATLEVSGADGNDQLKHFEALQFDDFTYNTSGNNAPVGVLRSGLTTDENSDPTGTFDVAVDLYDFDGDAISVDSVSVSGGGTISFSNTAASQAAAMGSSAGLQISFTPGTAYDYLAVGEDTFETIAVEISDGNGGTTTLNYVLTITGTNDAPIAHVDGGTTDENAAITIDVLANDTDVDLSDTHTVDSVSVTSGGGTASIVGNQVLWDPGTDYDYLAIGDTATVELAYDMSDDKGGVDSSTVTITVTGSNDAPVAVADAATTEENTVVTIDVLANDSDPDNGDTLTIASATVAANSGSVSIVGGQLEWDPGADFDYLNDGETATVVVDYTVTDGNGGNTPSTATITVTGTNDASAGFVQFVLDDVGPGLQMLDLDAQYVHSAELNGDGTKIVFSSSDSTLVTGDTNSHNDIYVKDLDTGDYTVASTASDGTFGNDHAHNASMSADGTTVSFDSRSNNLVTGDTNNQSDIFVKDLDTGALERASVSASGAQANGYSGQSSISGDGNMVGFYSRASNLVTNDTNGQYDYFVKNMATGAVINASTSTTGVQGNASSYYGEVSADGNFAVFYSYANNLVAGDTNYNPDVFRKNLVTGELELVSENAAGTIANSYSSDASISADGRFVAFRSNADNLVAGDTNGRSDVFVKDMDTGTVTLVSSDSGGVQSNSYSYSPKISADGRYVTFHSQATNFNSEPGAANGLIYVKDLQTGDLTLISEDLPSDTYPNDPDISGDGSTISFYTYSYSGSSIYDIYVGDVESIVANQGLAVDFNQVALEIAYPVAGVDLHVDWGNGTSDSTVAATAGDAYRLRGTFEPELNTVATVTVSSGGTVLDTQSINVQTAKAYNPLQVVSSDESGTEGNSYSYSPNVSRDGSFVVFQSSSNNLVSGDTNGRTDIFIKNLSSGDIERVSTDAAGNQSNNYSSQPFTDADGNVVAFGSSASNLVADDTNGQHDIFVKNLDTGDVQRANTASDGTQANNYSYYPTLSADGNKVVFTSSASNLTTNDGNGRYDVFVKDLDTGVTTLVSDNTSGISGNGDSRQGWISADGNHVVFQSNASDLVAGDTNSRQDIFIKDLTTGVTTLVSSDGATQANQYSLDASVSADGGVVVFTTIATNFTGSSSNYYDIWAKDMTTGDLTLVNTDASGNSVSGTSYDPEISADGRYVTFYSSANLVPGSYTGYHEIYRKDLLTGEIEQIESDSSGSGYDYQPTISHDGSVVAYYTYDYNNYYSYQVYASNLAAEGSTLTGTADVDILIGHNASDELFGLAGDDRLSGGEGMDLIDGGAGNDILTGGLDSDTFVFEIGSGVDLIGDFEDGIDQINVSGYGFTSFAQLNISVGTSSSEIDFNGVDNVTVADVTSLTSDDFIFA